MQVILEKKSTDPQHHLTDETIEAGLTKEDTGADLKKLNVECICPKCGKQHMMSIHWIGRGKPRKFCNSCRDSNHD